MANKITKEMQYSSLRELAEQAERADLVAFVDNEIALLRKKNSHRSNKPTKNAVENADYGMKVLDAMSTDKAYTITDIQNLVPDLKELSNQRVTAIVGALKDAGTLKREVIKGKAYYSLA